MSKQKALTIAKRTRPFTLMGLRVEPHECPTCNGLGVIWRAGKIGKAKKRKVRGVDIAQ